MALHGFEALHFIFSSPSAQHVLYFSVVVMVLANKHLPLHHIRDVKCSTVYKRASTMQHFIFK